MAELAPAGIHGQFNLGFAGDTFNTVWYLRALRPDIQVDYFTCVGRDGLSGPLLDMMANSGIGASYVVRSNERSLGLYLISLQNGERSFSYWRDNSAARLLARDHARLTDAVKNADLVYFSGITLAILDATGRDVLLDVLNAARSQGKTIAFDPNLRPKLWSSTQEMTSTIMQAATVSDYILPSFEDETVFFEDADVAATAARYMQAGATSVVVKDGAGPVQYWHDQQHGEVGVVPASNVVDTTSAGDSFNAGFFAGLDQRKSMPELIRTAAQVAGQAIGGKGALVPIDLSAIDI